MAFPWLASKTNAKKKSTGDKKPSEKITIETATENKTETDSKPESTARKRQRARQTDEK